MNFPRKKTIYIRKEVITPAKKWLQILGWLNSWTTGILVLPRLYMEHLGILPQSTSSLEGLRRRLMFTDMGSCFLSSSLGRGLLILPVWPAILCYSVGYAFTIFPLSVLCFKFITSSDAFS